MISRAGIAGSLAVALLLAFVPGPARAAEPDSLEVMEHGAEGWEFHSPDRRFTMRLASRFQFRFSTPFEADPTTTNDFQASDKATFRVSRARLKIGGSAFEPWLRYYWEYELGTGNLLDFRLMVEKAPWMSVKVGQWKTDYNRETVISSGRQQMADRSLINKPFTLDRQQGVALYGHLAGSRPIANANYWVAALTGMGRGGVENDDDALMYAGRFQWNPLGRAVPMQGSDTRIHEKPALLVAVGGMTNRSPFTRYSQAGGGQLEGFAPGAPGQYRLHQALLETAYMHRGFSWQQELHFKEVVDRAAGSTTTLTGVYLQAGYFVHQAWRGWPQPLEAAYRFTRYDPNRDVADDREAEHTLAFNWFFDGHLNKLTVEGSIFSLEQNTSDALDRTRFRAQWDISL